ncbi:histidine phosphatase superfamily [Daldinia sp. FL1419]|nr:histidine phosphatase superfamily [Daldinia sp. FL1419]
MSLTVHIIRHAQASHNVDRKARDVLDTYLTTLGLQQCAQVQRSFPHPLHAIISSPQRRAIQTALLCFGPAVVRGLEIELLAELQEVGSHPACRGVGIGVLENEFGTVVNTDGLADNWEQTGLSTDPKDVAERARYSRCYVREAGVWILDHTEEQHVQIAVVTHSLLIPFITNDYSQGKKYFHNTEWRSYTFKDLRGKDNVAELQETEESLARRGAQRPDEIQNSHGRVIIEEHVASRQGIKDPAPAQTS